MITHAHGDHARWGSKSYLCSVDGAGVLHTRMGPGAAISTLAYGETIALNGVRVSLHPAGHIHVWAADIPLATGRRDLCADGGLVAPQS